MTRERPLGADGELLEAAVMPGVDPFDHAALADRDGFWLGLGGDLGLAAEFAFPTARLANLAWS